MERIKVKVKQKDMDPDTYYILSNGVKIILPVLINNERNGFIGKILEVEAGTMDISIVPASTSKAIPVRLTLEPNSTSIKNPKEVIVNVS